MHLGPLILIVSFLSLFKAQVTSTTTCTDATDYYDASSLQCQQCSGTNQEPTSSDDSCQCAAGMGTSFLTSFNPIFNCATCAGATLPNAAQTQCYPCQGGSCTCATNEEPVQNSLTRSFICTPCSTNFESPSGTECTCPGVLKVDLCIELTNANYVTLQASYDENDGKVVTYENIQTNSGVSTRTISSDTVAYLYYRAAILCKENVDRQYCNQLLHLCALHLYDESANPCRYFTTEVIGSASSFNTNFYDANWKLGYPWMTYTGSTDSILRQPDKVQFRVTLGTSHSSTQVSSLPFYIAKWKFDGTYLGFEPLTDQLTLCPQAKTVVDQIKRFGSNINYSCDIDLRTLLDFDISGEPVFYSLWIQDPAQNNAFIDVPVVIRNMKDQAGSTPNSSDNNKSNWLLVRRFFLFDTLSGVTDNNSWAAGDPPTILRFAASTKLLVELQKDNQEEIYIPVFVIDYEERRVADITSDSTGLNKASIQIQSQYTSSIDSFWSTMMVVFILLNILVGVVTVIRMAIWSRYHPSSFSPDNYGWFVLFTLIFTLADTWAFIFFWFLFFVTGYWFIVFKLQESAFILLPQLDLYQENYLPFDIIFSIVIILKFFLLIVRMYRQTHIEVFFIDWEKPRLVRIYHDFDKNEVNAWRQIFVGNEFLELLNTRILSLPLIIFIFIFFYKGLGWENFADFRPFLDTDPKNSPNVFVLKFFLISFLMLAIAATQFVIRKLFSIWFPLKTQLFTDFCAVCNISVFILDSSLHGFYIHGQSAFGISDVSATKLETLLTNEQKGVGKERGLIPDDPKALQTFQIFIPFRMREDYEQVSLKSLRSFGYPQRKRFKECIAIIDFIINLSTRIDYPRLPAFTRVLPTGMDISELEARKAGLSDFLKEYIEQVRAEQKTYVREKKCMQRLMNYPPIDMKLTQGLPYFYKDPRLTFNRTTIQGVEWEMFYFLILTFFAFERALSNTFADLFMAYFIDSVFEVVRAYFMRRNVSSKTLIDERFMI